MKRRKYKKVERYEKYQEKNSGKKRRVERIEKQEGTKGGTEGHVGFFFEKYKKIPNNCMKNCKKKLISTITGNNLKFDIKYRNK